MEEKSIWVIGCWLMLGLVGLIVLAARDPLIALGVMLLLNAHKAFGHDYSPPLTKA